MINRQMYKTTIISGLFCMLVSVFGQAQVGINTSTPQAGLDVQGNLGVRKKIYLGGNDTTTGRLGQKGTVLVSQGAGLPPVWKVLRVPPFDPFLYFSFNTFGIQTQNGLIIGNVTSGTNIYTDGQSLASFLGSPASGNTINDLTQTININNPASVLVFSFETILHSNSNSTYTGADIACGVFVDNALKGVRVYTLNQPDTSIRPFYTFNLITAAQNLSIGSHTVKVACTRRANINNFTGNIGVGKSAYTGSSTNLNDFMAQSSLTIESYEKPNTSNTTPIYVP
ncbi:hypothetical protein MUU74_08085 [Chryseobacterium daecheongense]|uniref:hypothetical protein n=1 Tax=Chryseobacterium daecheongense TaxID=192389 RepID=UPI001FD6AB11|nr:hypothetical protein [Chryseobacterium daecheongense]UOU99900.1 hypothetical protein MUU74_08085 [Chryseobacterium daecheongense]